MRYLRPAITYKDEIKRRSQELYYTDDMMYYTGCLESHCIDISEDCGDYRYNYAVVEPATSKLIGFISYYVNWYAQNVYAFGLISFDKGNPVIGLALREVMHMIINQYHMHRMEFRCVGGNPVKRHYDNFCKRYNGRVIELKDVFKDRMGEYHNDYIYEIIIDKKGADK